MNEFNPNDVPIRPAATVMLIDDRPDLQLLMMERHAKTVFAGGMWVFPGGAIDDEDSFAEANSPRKSVRTDAQANELLGLESGGLAYYMAAIRETFEEAGVLLARRISDDSPLSISSENQHRFDALRDRLNANEISLDAILEQESLYADTAQIHYIARWITPPGGSRRFDARFFIAKIPRNQNPVHDDGELINSIWLTPREIIDRASRDEMVIMSPTLRMVKNLADFNSADDAITAAAANLPDDQARVHTETGIIVMPEESGYDDALTNVESGWIRLRPLPSGQ